MNDYPSNIVVKVLYQEYPEIARRVLNKVKEQLPEGVLTDHSQVEILVKNLCIHADIKPEDLCNNSKSRNAALLRRIIIVVVIKLYEPHVLSNLINDKASTKIVNKLKDALKISKKTVYQDIRLGLQHYRLYNDFQENVNSLYSKTLTHGKESS